MTVIVLKLFKIGYSVQYMPTSINGISLITSLSTRRATTEITAGINCGKVKKRRKNTTIGKNTCWHGLQRSELIDTAGLSTVFFLKQVQSQGSLQGCHCPPTFVLLFNASLGNKDLRQFLAFPFHYSSSNALNLFKSGRVTQPITRFVYFYNTCGSNQP